MTHDERSAAMEMMKNALSKPSLLTHGGAVDLEKLAKEREALLKEQADKEAEQAKK